MSTTHEAAAPLWTFERFEPGHIFGTLNVITDEARRRSWEAIYGPCPGDSLPEGVIVAAMMEAYVRAIQPRPDGNVHASQELSFSGQRVEWGALLQLTVSCAGKELKNGRRWVDFDVAASARDLSLLRGRIRSIWAE
ncbi:hypothetical protein [Falsigemmobacter faecalis]|uniref:Thioesterase n=1 Tax=Falsigemmobacter faecalis TaxID=2488730 RepID=A0A3P3DPL3_9RHOB|nr:hypothetical protein [Falsigemmobacter faecalis]RRH76189.1 hypothetical protein EG244_07165 [Falsigemmobacter faecalis]